MEKKAVFVLQHSHEIDGQVAEDSKLIGCYSSRTNAEAAIARLADKPGFRDHPQGFCIDRYVVDEDHWVDGFITVYPKA